MSKLERLLNLTAALLDTRIPLTAQQLRDRVPGYPEDLAAFRRAFERDKDELREMGMPLELTEIPGLNPPQDGYRILKEHAFLRDPGLLPDELAALHLATSAVKLEGVEGLEAFWKLGGLANAEGDGQAAGAATVAPLPADPQLVALFGAVADRRPVDITYNGKERRLDPYRLDFQRGHWYLTAYDHLREETRTYRVDRITGAVSVDELAGRFARPGDVVSGGRLEPWQLGDEDSVTALLLVDADQAPSVLAQVGEDALKEQRPDGSVVLELQVTNRAGFRSFVLGLLDGAQILEPPDLRQDLIDWLEALAGDAK